jgi:hypothetical protein
MTTRVYRRDDTWLRCGRCGVQLRVVIGKPVKLGDDERPVCLVCSLPPLGVR